MFHLLQGQDTREDCLNGMHIEMVSPGGPNREWTFAIEGLTLVA
jgi:hypothetical protein